MKKTECTDRYEFLNWVSQYEDGPEYTVPGETYASEHDDKGQLVHFVTTILGGVCLQFMVEGAKTLEEAVHFAREG